MSKAGPHSPEPWSVIDGSEILSAVDTENAMVIGGFGFLLIDGRQVPSAEVNAANARRVAACINAFAGWPTEAVEELAKANLANLELQRAEPPT